MVIPLYVCVCFFFFFLFFLLVFERVTTFLTSYLLELLMKSFQKWLLLTERINIKRVGGVGAVGLGAKMEICLP